MSLTANILLGYNDYVHNGSIHDTSCPFAAGAPAVNMLTEDLDKPVIFAPTAAEPTMSFVIDLGAAKPTDLIALIKHNINYTGKWRVQLNFDIADPVGQEYDSGWLTVIPPQPGFGVLTWGQFLWGGAIPEYNLGKYNRHAYLPLPNTVVIRYITVTIDAPSNTAPVKFYRLWASIGYQPSVNVQYGAEIVPIDETKVQKMSAGNRIYGDAVQRRQVNAGFDMLPRTEMLYNIVGALYLASGVKSPVICMLEPADPANYYVEAVYGNLTQIDKAVYSSWLMFSTTFAVEEQP